MTENTPRGPMYHALLIGIDAYPPRYNSLAGCVNDIDAIAHILLEPPGIGLPPEQVRITRLVAPRSGTPSASRPQDVVAAPTRENVVAALQKLAGPDVQPGDRVLIYYSGHGDQKTWPNSPVSHEAIVPHNGQDIQYLFDVQLNSLINAITARTGDITVILDSCHSDGATRGLGDGEEQGATRRLERTDGGADDEVVAPDLDLGDGSRGVGGAASSAGLLVSLQPQYLGVMACQGEERANEGVLGDAPRHGVLTYSLLQLLRDKPDRAGLRWADLWPDIIGHVSQGCLSLNREMQHPRLIGASARHVFGGPWVPQDPGYAVTQAADGAYTIGAGELMGVTKGAVIGVYGAEPAMFPTLDSEADKAARRGCLKVTDAQRASATARPCSCDGKDDADAFPLPPGARGRLVKPGLALRMRVLLAPPDDVVAAKVNESPLLTVVGPDAANAEVRVNGMPDGSWRIINALKEEVGVVPAREVDALVAGLNAYAGYNQVLRTAHSCNDAQLSGALSLRVLDASGVGQMSAEQLADPPLNEVHRDPASGAYAVPAGTRFCVQMANTSSKALKVTLFECGAGGAVESMGHVSLNPGDRQIVWRNGVRGKPFGVNPDFPGRWNTDQLVAIATTRPDVDLSYLAAPQTVQQAIDDALGGVDRGLIPDEDAGPAELWTAVIVPLRVGPKT